MPITQQRMVDVLEIAKAAIDGLELLSESLKHKFAQVQDEGGALAALEELVSLLPICALSSTQTGRIYAERQHFKDSWKYNTRNADRLAKRRQQTGGLSRSEQKVLEYAEFSYDQRELETPTEELAATAAKAQNDAAAIERIAESLLADHGLNPYGPPRDVPEPQALRSRPSRASDPEPDVVIED